MALVFFSSQVNNLITESEAKIIKLRIKWQILYYIFYFQIQSILSFCFHFVLLCAVTSGKETDTQGTRIVYTADKRICQNITW